MFTFKKQPNETGLASVGQPYPCTDIKLSGKVVGEIVAPTWRSKDDQWAIRFMVENGGTWTWRQLKERFPDEPAARQYIKNYTVGLLKLKLHGMDPD